VLAVSIIKLANERVFEATSGTLLLDAALASGVTLPYSCRTGRCGTCKTKVHSGHTHPTLAESALSATELTEGWILTCARVAESDVVLETEDISGVELTPPRTFPARILSKESLAPTVLRVVLRLPPTAKFKFIAGQYIDVIGPAGVRRSYSIAGATSDNTLLELHIAAVEGGVMSQYWFNDARPNDLLRLNGPLGTFFMRNTSGFDLIFLATGTGIAPIKSMLESLLTNAAKDRGPNSVTVLWGGREAKDHYLDINQIYTECDYIPVHSRPVADWTGAKGYVQDTLLRRKLNFINCSVYACGSEAMIKSAKKQVLAAGLPSQRFYSDAFVSSEN
jgi:CDP-4-dehydro-6-deoxyglucose reductase